MFFYSSKLAENQQHLEIEQLYTISFVRFYSDVKAKVWFFYAQSETRPRHPGPQETQGAHGPAHGPWPSSQALALLWDLRDDVLVWR